ncbi:hypothetical protein Vafri_15882 [Volvox africanus]|nr:hypothetical protein Vafri_15882 [Volvox africanus]
MPERVLRIGEPAVIRTAVVCSVIPVVSVVDIFYTSDATMTPNRTWVLLSSVPCIPSTDFNGQPAVTNITSSSFVIPTGVLDATLVARVQLREVIPGTRAIAAAARSDTAPCSNDMYGSSSDRDDIVVRVCPALPGTESFRTTEGGTGEGVEVRASGTVTLRRPIWKLLAARRVAGF